MCFGIPVGLIDHYRDRRRSSQTEAWRSRACDGRNSTALTSNCQVDVTGGELSPEILEACRRGDREAFRALYEAYKDRVYSIAFYFFHADPDAAAEVTQQVFLKLMREIVRFRGDAAFSTWLYRLVMNACVDHMRGRRGDVTGQDPVTLDTVWCSGAAMLLRRSAFESVGGFAARIFMYGEDVDLSWRLRASLRSALSSGRTG